MAVTTNTLSSDTKNAFSSLLRARTSLSLRAAGAWLPRPAINAECAGLALEARQTLAAVVTLRNKSRGQVRSGQRSE